MYEIHNEKKQRTYTVSATITIKILERLLYLEGNYDKNIQCVSETRNKIKNQIKKKYNDMKTERVYIYALCQSIFIIH